MGSRMSTNGTQTIQPANGTFPTTANLSSFVQSTFPLRQGDTPFHYHTPRAVKFNAHISTTSHVVLSITPTPGFYAALSASPSPTPLAFLHRPWQLDRRRVSRMTTVLSCHKGFDEVLTVGNNAALASILRMDLGRSAIIQGYKGDPDRTIGVVGPVPSSRRGCLLESITAEFSSVEGAFGFDDDSDVKVLDGSLQDIKAVAIMNAFHPEEVERVGALAFDLGILPSAEGCGSVLYLTGAVREQGLQAAREKGMTVVCVGHRACEEWGIKYLARLLQSTWPSLRVDTILEDEKC